jgi:hypothetical protein
MNQDLSGLPVKCPNCKKILFKTTDKYDPNVSPRGDMLKSLVTYHLDFLLTSSTPVSSLTCPECTCQLAPYGRLTVIEPVPPFIIPEGVLTEEEAKQAAETPGRLFPLGEIPQAETPVPPEEITPEAAQKAQPLNSFTDTGIRIPMEEANELDEALDKVSVGPQIFICDICGKECKSQFGLNSHKRSHK